MYEFVCLCEYRLLPSWCQVQNPQLQFCFLSHRATLSNFLVSVDGMRLYQNLQMWDWRNFGYGGRLISHSKTTSALGFLVPGCASGYYGKLEIYGIWWLKSGLLINNAKATLNARSYPSPHYSHALTALAAQSRYFFLQVPYAAWTIIR